MAWIWVRRSPRQARVGPIVGLAGTVVAGSVLGSLAIDLGNAAVFGGRADMLEYVRMAYLGTAAMYVVRLMDRLLMRGVATVARVRIDSVGHIGARSAWRTVLALLVQRALLLAVALPYLLTMFVIFRPRVQHGIAGRDLAGGGIELSLVQRMSQGANEPVGAIAG